MEPPIEQNASRSPLSSLARQMAALKDDVFRRWEERVREQIAAARALQHPLLVDTLPAFYDNIVESVDPGAARMLAVDGSTIAVEHGGERARITAYSHRALIEEYQIFRWAMFDVLHAHGVTLSQDQMHTLHASVDAGIQEAVEGFILVHNGLRERFAAALTHDMRGPLATTAMGLELILATADPQVARTAATRALANVRRMAGMVDELLHTMAFHGGEAVHLTLAECDLAGIVDEAAAEAAALHGPRFNVQGVAATGYWDRAALRRVLDNLLGNAVKYGAPGTPITITTDTLHERVVISVHNEGAPIPPAEQECIFQLYQRAESARRDVHQGWGIGLPYVRAIAESHGGSIGLDTSAGRGTTFIVDIPRDSRVASDAPTLERGAP